MQSRFRNPRGPRAVNDRVGKGGANRATEGCGRRRRRPPRPEAEPVPRRRCQQQQLFPQLLSQLLPQPLPQPLLPPQQQQRTMMMRMIHRQELLPPKHIMLLHSADMSAEFFPDPPTADRR